MSVKDKINRLWDEFRLSINAAYAACSASIADAEERSNGLYLRDYAENISWSDATARLLGREAAEERRHRSGRPSVPGFSIDSAAKLMLMHFAADGSSQVNMPPATQFLVCRQTAAEAALVGFLARSFITDKWREEVRSLDYAKLMEVKS